MPFNIAENIGLKLNKLTLVGLHSIMKNGTRKVSLNCECGKQINIVLNSFLYGKTKSCGCFRNQENSRRNKTHGLSNHPLYIIWSRMVQRCYDVNDKSYPRYGGKGVQMSKEWRTHPEQFIEWAIKNGWERGLQLDKDILSKRLGIYPAIYSSDTCCFVTSKINSNNKVSNKYVLYNGINYTISELSEKLKMSVGAIAHRIKMGWAMCDIANTPVGKYIGSNRFVRNKSSFIPHSFGHFIKTNTQEAA